MSFLDLKLNNINYQLGVLTAASGLVNIANTQVSSVFYPTFVPTFGSSQPVSINQSGLTYRPNTDTLTTTGLVCGTNTTTNLTAGVINNLVTASISSSPTAIQAYSNPPTATPSISVVLASPIAFYLPVGMYITIRGSSNAIFNNNRYKILARLSSLILSVENPLNILQGTTAGGGTIEYGIITADEVNATNLNGKINVVGATNNSGNLVLCNNTTNTTGNYNLLTDSNQHLKFTATNNVLTVGGSTNGSIVIPSTAGFITANKIASNSATKLSLDSLETSGTIEIQKSAVKTGEILYANASFPLQIKSTLGISIDAAAGGYTNISSGGTTAGTAISLITGNAIRAQVLDGGFSCYNLQNLGNNNLNLTSFYAGGSPALLFNAHAYNNTSLIGRYMVINSAGIQFEDGNSAGPTPLAGVNNVGFYIPSSGYLIPGVRFNTFFGGTFPNVDMVLFPNAGGTVSITSLGTNPVYSNGGRLSNTGPSDRTLKENINPLNSQLENILKLRPVSFNWIDKKWNGDKLYNGFIAQEVQEINDISGLVSTFKDNHDNDKLGFDVIGLIPFIVKAVQEQNELIVNQQKQIDNQQKQIDELKLLVTQLLNK